MSLEIFQKMINKKALVPVIQKHEKYSIILEEPDVSNSKVIISSVPVDIIALKIDKFPPPLQFFNGSKGECKRADFALIADNGKKKRIIIIELKRTKEHKNYIIKQLKGAKCVIDYCKEIAKQFYNCKNPLSGFEIRYVSFCHTNSTGKTRIDKAAKIHDKPDKMLRISSPKYIHYNKLAK